MDDSFLGPVFRVTEELARYARDQHLSEADELLTELMAAIVSTGLSSLDERLCSEERAVRAIYGLWHPADPDLPA